MRSGSDFVVTIILARLLSPADYGIIALVMVFVNVANVFVTSSFSFRPHTKERCRRS